MNLAAEVTAIIPTWNRRDLLERLLTDLRKQTYPVRETLVMDNGSTDGSAEMAEHAGAKVIRMDGNAGFAHAVNCGIRVCQTEWLAILNNDIALEPDWLERLLQAAETERAYFATGKLLNASNPAILDGTFDLIARSGCAWRCGSGKPDGKLWAQLMVIEMAPFTAALFRKDLFQRVGLLDERFESYLEDVDFGLRCTVLGCQGVYVPEAIAYHQGSATLGAWHPDTVRRVARNQTWLVAKHLRAGGLWPVLAGQLLWGLVAIRHGAGLAWCRGKWQGVRRFMNLRRGTSGQASPPAEFMRRSENKIWALQKQTGFDLYWRIYFCLTRGWARRDPER